MNVSKLRVLSLKNIYVISTGLIINISLIMLVFFGFVFPELIPNLSSPVKAIKIMNNVSDYSLYVSMLGVVFCLFYLFTTPFVPKNKKWLWCVVLLLAHVFAAPFFWYFYILKRGKQNRK